MLRYAGIWLLIHVLGRLRLSANAWYAVADAVAAAGWTLRPSVRAATRDHMQHVLGPDAPPGEVDAAARGCVRTVARYYADLARYAYLPPEAVFDSIDLIEGLDALFEAYDEGRGVVVVSAHVGNPEFIAQALGALNLDMMVFTEPLHPRRLHDLVHRVRGRTGVCFVPVGLAGVRKAIAMLRRGGIVGALIDRSIGTPGRPHPFFGEPAPIPTGPVEFARRTDAAVLAAFVLRTTPGRYAVHLERVELPPAVGEADADIGSGMCVVVEALERGIRRAPDQWFALEPIWAEPSVSRRRRRRPANVQ